MIYHRYTIFAVYHQCIMKREWGGGNVSNLDVHLVENRDITSLKVGREMDVVTLT